MQNSKLTPEPLVAQIFTKFASVMLELSIDKALDYGVTAEQAHLLKKGMLVEVPVRGHLRRGYLIDLKEKPSFPKVLPLAKIVSEVPLINEELFTLALWMAKYYYTPLGQVLKIMLPGSIRRQTQGKQQLQVLRGKSKEHLRLACIELRETHPAQANVLDVLLQTSKGMLLSELLEKTEGSRSPVDSLAKKGLVLLENVQIGRSPLADQEYFLTKPKKLNEEQKNVLDKIESSLKESRFETHLLFGVTGSGKTEVYLQAISCALAMGRGAIMLVPEIALTAQTVERFCSRFPKKIAVLHHRLSEGERHDEWHRIRTGEASIVIGARSAIFSPLANLGLIIVDEEHEQTYKQTEEHPCYHARDVAVMRSHLSQATIILGSATPSLESYYNAKQNKYSLSTLKVRADSASLPKVTIIDMKKEYEKAKGFTIFSEPLLKAIQQRYQIGEQSILFLNRRGYHTTQICGACMEPIKCQHCDVSLTFHFSENVLACHLCGYRLCPPPSQCPACKSGQTLKFKGVGTEQVERVLHAILPGVRTLRVDADTTKHKGSHEKLLREFRTGKADVLIGTQMVAKGLHFPAVTLVGVLNCDTGLQIPDFRASEKVFQLITQVSGRSGRGVIAGEVMIQTALVDNPTIKLATAQNFEHFFEEEIAIRKLFNYPPIVHMVKLTFIGDIEGKTLAAAHEFYLAIQQQLPASYLLNPVVPAGYSKVKDKFRFQFFLRGKSVYLMNEQIAAVRKLRQLPSGVALYIDVDPLSTFF